MAAALSLIDTWAEATAMHDWLDVRVTGPSGKAVLALRTTRGGELGWQRSSQERDGLVSTEKLRKQLLEVTADVTAQLAYQDKARGVVSLTLAGYDDLLVDDDEADALERDRVAVVTAAQESAGAQRSLLVLIVDGRIQEACLPVDGGWLSNAAGCQFLPERAEPTPG